MEGSQVTLHWLSHPCEADTQDEPRDLLRSWLRYSLRLVLRSVPPCEMRYADGHRSVWTLQAAFCALHSSAPVR